MSCLSVDVKPVASELLAKASGITSELGLSVYTHSGNLYFASAVLSGLKASVGCTGDRVDVEANGVSSGLNVSVAITCGTDLLNEYYLLVEEGYTLLIDDRRIKVIGNW